MHVVHASVVKFKYKGSTTFRLSDNSIYSFQVCTHCIQVQNIFRDCVVISVNICLGRSYGGQGKDLLEGSQVS